MIKAEYKTQYFNERKVKLFVTGVTANKDGLAAIDASSCNIVL